MLQPDPQAEKLPYEWQAKERANLRAKIESPLHTYIADSVYRWHSNNRCVPVHTFKEAGLLVPEGQQEAQERDNAAIIAKMRAMPRHEPTAEELGEMENAFGESVVVNIITGQRYDLRK